MVERRQLRTWPKLIAHSLLALSIACPSKSGLGPTPDGGTDAGIDGGTDGGTDAGVDGGTDAGVDGGTDAGVDGGSDAGPFLMSCRPSFDETIDRQQAGPIPIAVDGRGAIHLLYQGYIGGIGGTNGIVHASTESGAWQFQLVYPGGNNVASDLKVGADGVVHALFITGSPFQVVYAKRGTDQRWITSVVGAGIASAGSLALSGSGAPWIALQDSATTSYFAYADGGGWSLEPIDPALYTSGGSLAADGGVAYLVYQHSDTNGPGTRQLFYATRSASGSWSRTSMGIADDAGFGPTGIALDPSGSPQVAYVASDGTVWVATADGGWSGQLAANGQMWVGTEMSFTIDDRGSRHLGLQSTAPDYAATYITDRTGAWTTLELVTSAFENSEVTLAPGGEPIAVAPDLNGNVHLVHPCPGPCTPSCSGRACGTDGCGGTCPGTCASGPCQGNSCLSGCVVSCGGKTCGFDGCSGSCGSCAACSTSGACGSCAPQCSGRSCGPDGCGASCGSCATGSVCCAGGSCGNGLGDSCAQDADCCSGDCDPTFLRCTQCRQSGSGCTAGSQCCSGSCAAGRCG